MENLLKVNSIKPIFIFSLPRSGSTLLQRILGASSHIATVAEPWILLPYVYTLKETGIISEYGHCYAFEAIKDFYAKFPNSKRDYIEELRNFILNLYKKASNDSSTYFLDKTPRYSLICDEIIDIFPDGKFIFLWRNPLAIISSIINSWGKGKWKVNFYNIDIYDGIQNLLKSYSKHKSIAHSVQYEKLVKNPRNELQKIFDYLELPFDEEILTTFRNINFGQGMGDRIGTKKYHSLSTDSLDKWKKILYNSFRKFMAKRYLNWLGFDNLALMGYNRLELENIFLHAQKSKMRNMLGDLIYFTAIKLGNLVSPLKTQGKRITKFRYM